MPRRAFIQTSLTRQPQRVWPTTLPPRAIYACAEACSDWLQRRYGITVDAATQVLPVNGSREALFSFAQTIVDPSQPGATVLCPNPFYQIYEGATLLAGATPYFVASDPARNFAVDWDSVPARWSGSVPADVCLLARQPHRAR